MAEIKNQLVGIKKSMAEIKNQLVGIKDQRGIYDNW